MDKWVNTHEKLKRILRKELEVRRFLLDLLCQEEKTLIAQDEILLREITSMKSTYLKEVKSIFDRRRSFTKTLLELAKELLPKEIDEADTFPLEKISLIDEEGGCETLLLFESIATLIKKIEDQINLNLSLNHLNKIEIAPKTSGTNKRFLMTLEDFEGE